MRHLFHLLIVLSVMWCGLHFDDPALAAEPVGHLEAVVEAPAALGDDNAGHSGPSNAAHAGHHHCPLAPDQRASALQCAVIPGDALLSRRDVPDLTSVLRQPPLEPPLS